VENQHGHVYEFEGDYCAIFKFEAFGKFEAVHDVHECTATARGEDDSVFGRRRSYRNGKDHTDTVAGDAREVAIMTVSEDDKRSAGFKILTNFAGENGLYVNNTARTIAADMYMIPLVVYVASLVLKLLEK
jgi:hypothetical protein